MSADLPLLSMCKCVEWLPKWAVTAPDLYTFKKGLAQTIPDNLVEYV